MRIFIKIRCRITASQTKDGVMQSITFTNRHCVRQAVMSVVRPEAYKNKTVLHDVCKEWRHGKRENLRPGMSWKDKDDLMKAGRFCPEILKQMCTDFVQTLIKLLRIAATCFLARTHLPTILALPETRSWDVEILSLLGFGFCCKIWVCHSCCIRSIL